MTKAKPTLILRILEQIFTLQHHPAARHPDDDNWYVLVRAPEGLTVIREAQAETPADERWLGVYDAEAGHGLDVPGLLSAVVHPLAEAAIPVFVASTYHADLVLTPEQRRADVLATLRSAGHKLLGT